jgi:hypothetical protein
VNLAQNKWSAQPAAQLFAPASEPTRPLQRPRSELPMNVSAPPRKTATPDNLHTLD